MEDNLEINNPILTILTPTYNRKKLLHLLYESLKKQTNRCFEWLVIDDGSKDNTYSYMMDICNNDRMVQYYYKKNGGKHSALNFSHSYIRGEIVCIVDSDDILTGNAVEVILSDWKQYCTDKRIGMLSYQKGKMNGAVISENIGEPDSYISDEIHFIINHNIHGDRFEVVRTDLLKLYAFPVFEGEQFMSEGWLWNHIAVNYKTVYRRLVIYKCEYLDDGLTKSGRKIRLLSPRGMMENCKSFFVKDVCVRIQLKEMLLFCVYGLASGLTIHEILAISNRPIRICMVMPFGMLIYEFWKWKYCKD